MKTAKAKAKSDITARPLLELLAMIEPEDHLQLRDFEYEVDLAWEQFRKEHPLGLRQDELNFDMEAAGQAEGVCVVLAKKLYATGKFVAYCNSFYGESHEKARAWQAAEPDFEVLGSLLQERFHDFRLAWLARHLTSAEIVRGIHERSFSGRIDDDRRPILAAVGGADLPESVAARTADNPRIPVHPAAPGGHSPHESAVQRVDVDRHHAGALGGHPDPVSLEDGWLTRWWF